MTATGWTGVRFPPGSGDVGAPSPDVHVWLLDLDPPRWLLGRLADALDAGEAARAESLRSRRDANRYTAAHGLVRHILAGYLGVPAAELTFAHGRYGKPMLAGPTAGLRFNLSHSGGLGLCAVCAGREVGVDIQRMRIDRDHTGLAGRYFSPAERTALRSVPDGQRRRAFYACWTRKEAYLKARGDGLTVPLDSFDVPVAPDAPPTLLEPAAARRPPPWRLATVPVPPRFAGAVVAAGTGWRVRRFAPVPVGRKTGGERGPQAPESVCR